MNFKFAAEADSEDLISFIRESENNQIKDSQTKNFVQIDNEEIENNLFNLEIKWLLIETIYEDLLVGTARFWIDESTKIGRLDSFVAVGTSAIKNLILKKLLTSVEEICLSFDVSTLVIEFSEAKKEYQDFVLTCGYFDKAGYINKNDNKTMIIEYHKEILKAPVNISHHKSMDSSTKVNETVFDFVNRNDMNNEFPTQSNSKVDIQANDRKEIDESETIAICDTFKSFIQNSTNDTEQTNDFPLDIFESLFSALHEEYDSK